MARIKKVNTTESEVAKAWGHVARTPEGRLALAYLFSSIYDVSTPTDPVSAGILIGERNVAVRIAAMCGRNPETFMADMMEDINSIEGMSEQLAQNARYS